MNIGPDRLFYLATAPEYFAPIIENLGAQGMAQPEQGRVGVVIEKPFGHDLESAQRTQPPGQRRLPREPGLPHRPLPRQRDGAEHFGLPFRQRHLRADLESQLHRPRADHGRRNAGRRRPRAVLREGRRTARRGAEPRDGAAELRRDGAALELRRRGGAPRKGEGVARDSRPFRF